MPPKKGGKTAKPKASASKRTREKSESSSEDEAPKPKPAKALKASAISPVDIKDVNFDSEACSGSGHKWNMKISSWNVNGIRAWMDKGGLKFLELENPDIFLIQETKCSDDKLPPSIKNVKGYHCYWLAGDKAGYSGLGLLSKTEPKNVTYGIGVDKHDKEGRVITAEFEHFYLINTYVPNAGRGLVRLNYRKEWNTDFDHYLTTLDKKKTVILGGDMNVAHNEIDIANPKTNTKSAGFTPEERAGFTKLLSLGFVDSFRHLHPDAKDVYTFWTYLSNARVRNVGWRLDYFIVSERLQPKVCEVLVRKDVYGSDHCPITLLVHV